MGGTGQPVQHINPGTDYSATNISASVAVYPAVWTGAPNVVVGSVNDNPAFWSDGENQVVGSVANAPQFYSDAGTAYPQWIGGGQPYNVLNPFITLNYIIKT
jgi:hypothetical protein